MELQISISSFSPDGKSINVSDESTWGSAGLPLRNLYDVFLVAIKKNVGTSDQDITASSVDNSNAGVADSWTVNAEPDGWYRMVAVAVQIYQVGSYDSNDLVSDGGTIFKSLIDGNTEPTSDEDAWVEVTPYEVYSESLADLYGAVDVVKLVRSDIFRAELYAKIYPVRINNIKDFNDKTVETYDFFLTCATIWAKKLNYMSAEKCVQVLDSIRKNTKFK